ncbi:MAG: universal stress protein [Bacteroidales bacterium]|nr:universal stress protein [Bacteroidales bacterium]
MKSNLIILVPIDFSKKSLLAFEQAKHLAKTSKSDIMLLNVIQPDNKTFSFVQSIFSDVERASMNQRIEDGIREQLNQLIKKNSTSDIDIKAMVVTGKVYDQIIEVSKSLNCNYIVIGVNDADKENDSHVLGSNASRVVRTSEIPVITVNNTIVKEIKTVILPLDLTKETQQKVAKAIQFAKLTNAKIKIVTALLTDDPSIVSVLQHQMGFVEKFIKENYGNVSADFVFGNHDDDTLSGLVLKFSEENNGDIIVVMTQQETKLMKLFMGTTALDIIYNSHVPVFSVVPKEINRLKY